MLILHLRFVLTHCISNPSFNANKHSQKNLKRCVLPPPFSANWQMLGEMDGFFGLSCGSSNPTDLTWWITGACSAAYRAHETSFRSYFGAAGVRITDRRREAIWDDSVHANSRLIHQAPNQNHGYASRGRSMWPCQDEENSGDPQR